MEEFIKKLALQNAVKHNGKANAKALVGTVFGEYPKSRENKKDTITLINKIVDEINNLSIEEQTKELTYINPEFFEKKEQKEGLKELKNATPKNVVMRFEPSPSGGLHIGHAYQLTLNAEYSNMYNGKLVLRISDTNPDNIAPEAYDIIKENSLWLTNNGVTNFVIQSDRMELYYQYALQLIGEGNAYVCNCSTEDWKEIVNSRQDCPHRNQKAELQVIKWHYMFDKETGYQPGQAVVRCKTDMTHKNPALRDFPILRINDTPHARTENKYRVWPLLNFAVPVDDSDNGITHVLRGKDHYDNTKRQIYILEYLKLDKPEYIHTGRINFIGLPLSSTDARAGIQDGKYQGWDDIRLPFLSALKKRGYQPEAFRKFFISMGVTMVDKSVDGNEFFKSLNHYNKEIIDSKSDRFFFIKDPVSLIIKGSPSLDIELDLHPQFKEGGRKFKTNEIFYIEKEDLKSISEGELVRLMDCLNFIKQGSEFIFVSRDYKDFKKNGKHIMHWLPYKDNLVKTKVRMPDNSIIEGLAESNITEVEEEQVVQFERFGFCRLNKDIFWFGHR